MSILEETPRMVKLNRGRRFEGAFQGLPVLLQLQCSALSALSTRSIGVLTAHLSCLQEAFVYFCVDSAF